MKKVLGVVCSLAMAANYILPVYAQEGIKPETTLIGDLVAGTYTGQEDLKESESTAGEAESTFIKISHPENPANKMEHDPTENEKERKIHEQTEVWPDGLLDYVGDGKLIEPKLGVGPKENPGDRSQSYSWTGIGYGDWMYVSTQFNSSGLTGDLMGTPVNPESADKSYGGDYFAGVEDGGEPGNTLSKINVKTGEVKILMSLSKNNLNAQFRNSVEYKGKLYFCGSVNHVPSIYEVDPTNDAFKCVYQDPSMVNYPGGLSEAWKVARNERLICPTIRGLTTFKDYLVINCVGLDENPYIAITDDPDKGFKTIARTWKDVELDHTGRFVKGAPAELYGYPACHIPDSIFGGSIWEMAEIDGKLYVAMCTGTPDIARAKGHTHMEPKLDENGEETGEEIEVIDEMQSFAIVRGELVSADADPTSMDSWKWTPVVGDQDDGALYPFGIDEERTRSGACNLVKFNGKLYIGEYNDTQIAFQNMQQKQFTFLKENLEQSVSFYRMDFDENGNEKFVKIMGDPTTRFPSTESGNHTKSGFGTEERSAKETQYIWQSKVFNNKLYLGTFDETMILKPLIKEISEQMKQMQNEMEVAASLSTLADDEPDKETVALYKTVESKVKKDKRKGLLKHLESYFDAQKNPSMLPEEIVEAEPIVKVDSVDTLYEALLKADELSKSSEDTGIREEAAAVSQYLKLNKEVSTYLDTTEDEIPDVLKGAAQTFAGNEDIQSMYEEVQYILENMEGAIAGFDMHVSADGSHFEKITVNGFGDPYNQGLRAFAVNNDPKNSWMAIGTANAFYGTSIWRKEDLNNKKIVDPAQHEVTLKFVDAKTKKEVKNALDQGDTIYVNVKKDGKLEKVVPKTIEQLLPKDHTFVDDKTPVEVKDDVVVLEVNADVKDVIVHFQGKDESENLGMGKVQVLRSKDKLSYKDLAGILPVGFTLKNPSDTFKIEKNDEKQNIAVVPIVKGQTATILNGQASVEKIVLQEFEKNKVCIAPKQKVTVTADEKDGKTFTGWKITLGDVVLEDETSLSTTFEMPDEEIVLEAMFEVSDSKKELGKIIEEAEKINPDEYTENSAQIFEEAFNKAKEVYENESSSLEEMDEAAEKLKEAMNGLEEKINRKALIEAIELAEEKDPSIYTEETLEVFEQALAHAKEVNNSASVSQEEVDAATQELVRATQDLVQIPGTVNKEQLRKMIRLAQEKDLTLYTEESVQALQMALTQAKEVNDSTSALQEEVDVATQNLSNAIDGLRLMQDVDKTKLAQTIAQAEQINVNLYTPESVQVLQLALAHAKEVYDSTSVSQEEVNAACNELNQALQSLQKPAPVQIDKSALAQAIEKAEKMDRTLYTSESLKSFDSALENAKKIYNDASSSQHVVDLATDTLVKAMNDVVKKSDVDKRELDKLISQAESKDRSLYTLESLKSFDSALENAKEVYMDESASQKEVDEAVKQLKKAMYRLAKKHTEQGTGVSTNVVLYGSLVLAMGVLVIWLRRRFK